MRMEATFHLRRLALAALLLLVGCGSPASARTDNMCEDPRVVAAFKARGWKDTCERHETYTYRDAAGEQKIQIVKIATGTRIVGDLIYTDSEVLVRFEDDRLENWGDALKLTLSGSHGDFYIRQALDANSGLIDCCAPRSNMYRMYVQRDAGKVCAFYEMKHPFHGVVRDCGSPDISGAVGYVAGAVTWRQAWAMVEERALVEIGSHVAPAGSIDMFLRFRRDADGTPYYLAEVRENPDDATKGSGARRDKPRFRFPAWRVEVMGGAMRFLGVRGELEGK